jgi:hypothetical protein
MKTLESLTQEFPKIFPVRANSRLPFPMFGFEVGDGWYTIIRNACLLIQHHITNARKHRANNLQFNRALMRSLHKNDEAGLIHYFTVGKEPDKWALQHAQEAKFNAIFRDIPDACPQVVAEQVKEKFGSLRFYVSGGDQFTDGVVQMLELMSEVTCEKCGHPGKIGGKGWLSCRCDICRGEQNV